MASRVVTCTSSSTRRGVAIDAIRSHRSIAAAIRWIRCDSHFAARDDDHGRARWAATRAVQTYETRHGRRVRRSRARRGGERRGDDARARERRIELRHDAAERTGAVAAGVPGAKVFKSAGDAELRRERGRDGARSSGAERGTGELVDDAHGARASATRVEHGTSARGEGASSAVGSIDVRVGREVQGKRVGERGGESDRGVGVGEGRHARVCEKVQAERREGRRRRGGVESTRQGLRASETSVAFTQCGFVAQ